MRETSKLRCLLAVVSALAIAGLALPAAAAQPVTSADPASSMFLSMTGGGYASASLECEPAGGSHPTADEACRSLLNVDGYFERLPYAEPRKVCPHYYDPVTVSASGSWRGRGVDYRETFYNRCVAEESTDRVFRF